MICLCLATYSVASQERENDSVFILPQYEVTASPAGLSVTGFKYISLDSVLKASGPALNLAQLLSRNTSLQIRDYNFNGLSLLSMRGTYAQHTGIYWNGFQINPSASQQPDLSLIPAGMFNSVSLLYGGSGSLYGSGNIGGSIHLNNDPVFDGRMLNRFSLAIGSFGEGSGSMMLGRSSGRWFSKTSLFFKTSQNDYPYKNLKGEEVRQENAEMLQYGIMHDLYRNIENRWLVGASVWYQFNDRKVPPSMTTGESDALQTDMSLRASMAVKRFLSKGVIGISAAFFNDYIFYNDPDTIVARSVWSEISSRKWESKLHARKQITGSSTLSGGIEFKAERVAGVYYADAACRDQLGLLMSWKQQLPGEWEVKASARQDLVRDYRAPFTPSVGLEGPLFRPVRMRAGIARNFRVPTFNDLFWEGSANPDLKPEDAWNLEAGLGVVSGKAMERTTFEIWISAFDAIVDNWIVWIPDGNIWRPQNLRKVRARGLEADARAVHRFRRGTLELNGSYSYSRSTNEKKVGPADNSYRKQLIYIPQHRFFMNLRLSVGTMGIFYGHAYTGKRYTASDNSGSLSPYSTGDIALQKEWSVPGFDLTLRFSSLNVWNEQYQAVEYYPMPGRSYRITLIMNLKNKENEKAKN